MGKLIWAALTTDEANLVDLVKFGRGNRFSWTELWCEISQLKRSDRYRSFDVPIFFLLGRYDRHVPAVLAEAYFASCEYGSVMQATYLVRTVGAQPTLRGTRKV
jgi:proline iminopeptidase